MMPAPLGPSLSGGATSTPSTNRKPATVSTGPLPLAYGASMRRQRTALPPRTDLTTRRKRLFATVMVRGLDLFERLKSRLLIDVPPPPDDPFYLPPEDLEALRPGEVLESRSIEVRFLRRRVKTDAWQVKFRSSDTRGAAVWGVTTVMIPRRPFNGSVRPLLSYQPAIDSLGATADPSYTLRHGDQLELPLMTLALRRGWAVVTTDYTGPQHAFGAGLLAAHFVLDGIRAAIAFAPAGFDAATPIGLWGYSGGAQATLFAAEHQRAYAPELNIVGAAAGGITGDPISSPDIFDGGSVLSGVWFGAMIGISRELDVDLLGATTPQGQALVASAAEMTVEQLLVSFPFLRLGDYLTVPGVLDIPGMQAVPNGFGQAAPIATMYLYHSVHDQNRSISDVEQLVQDYRSQGVDATCRRFRFGEHMIVSFTGTPSALRFLTARFGSPARRRWRRAQR